MSQLDAIARQIREVASREAQVLQSMMHASSDYEGTLDCVDGEMITGWAWDANRPTAVLEIAIFDGEKLLLTTPASIHRQDLEAGGKGMDTTLSKHRRQPH